jgi:hypothetical protein
MGVSASRIDQSGCEVKKKRRAVVLHPAPPPPRHRHRLFQAGNLELGPSVRCDGVTLRAGSPDGEVKKVAAWPLDC